MTKKKILVLVDWFAPGYKAGGPIQSCVNFAFSLKDKYDIYVLTTDTDHGETAPYEGIPTGRWITPLDPGFRVKYLPKAGLNWRVIKAEILELDADFIYLNHLFSPLFVVYPLWLKFRGQLKSRIVLCPRGALYDSALAVKPWKKAPFLRLFRWLGIQRRIVFHATNAREKEAILRFFPRSTVRTADNLPNSHQPAFQSRPKKAGSLDCIFIARIFPIKNLLYLISCLRNVTANVRLTIVGPVEDKAYWEECKREMERLPANLKISWAGPKRNEELMPILREHHIFALPTTGENFGHSIFEAFLSGRPVLISDQTPWLGLAARQTGWDLPLADPAAFTRVIEEAAAWDQDQFDRWARSAWQYARDFIQNPELQDQYQKLFV
ncbi:MAG TPA: glycosyltransferase family 4 protein [Puia sp.]|jgi:glycosyltransferase involved in cell wall biosynthesis|nr:glycosyltransferase family 4 protein [Puia sp.]